MGKEEACSQALAASGVASDHRQGPALGDTQARLALHHCQQRVRVAISHPGQCHLHGRAASGQAVWNGGSGGGR